MRKVFKSLWILSLVCHHLAGQAYRNLPLIESSYITTFTAEEGLPICTGEAFISPEGRLYVTTCGFDQSEGNVYLFEYDGYQKIQVPFHRQLGSFQAIPIYQGINEQGALFGSFYRRGPFDASVFRFYPQESKLEVFSLKEKLGKGGRILQVNHHPKYGYLIHAADLENEYLFKWEGITFQYIAQASKEKAPSDNSGRGVFDPLLLSQKDAIWYWEAEYTSLRKFDYQTKEVQLYDWRSFDGLDQPFSAINGLVQNEAGEVFISVFDGEAVYFYKFDPVRNDFQLFLSESSVSTQAEATFKTMFLDEAGNLLIRKIADSSKPVWWMIERESGKTYNYSSVFEAVQQQLPDTRASILRVQGRDFRENMLVVSNGGICLVELKSNNAMQAFPGAGTRGMIELPASRVLIKAERDVQFELLDIQNRALGQLSSTAYSCLSDYDYNHLSDFHKDEAGNIYLPLIADGNAFNRYNLATQRCSLIEVGIPFHRFTFFESDMVAIVHRETSELYYFDMQSGQLMPAIFKGSILRFGGTVFQLRYSEGGFLWVGTNNGLWKVNLETNEMIKPHGDLPFQKDQVYYIDEAENGDLWLATGEGGVQIYTPKTGDLKIIDKTKGLSNNTAISILKDEDGIRWVNTYNGLNLLDPRGKIHTKLYASDGLANSEGNRFSSLKTSDGKLLFGSVSGVTLIDPQILKQQFLSEDSLKIFLTKIRYFDKQLKKDTVTTEFLDHPPALSLPATQRFLELRFALSDFRRIQEHQYAYRFEWPEKNESSPWHFLGNNPELTLTNLPAGNYDLVIRASNFRGQETQQMIRMSLQVEDFFYNSLWFYLLIILLISVLPVLWLLRERFERQRLQRLVQERTKEIEEDKRVIETQAEQLKTLDEAKSRFFTNISHEFRTPLTVIRGMAQKVNQNPDQWLTKGIEMITRNADNLLNLTNQILDLRKLEAGRLEPKMIQGDIIPYVNYISESFHSLGDSKGVTLQFQSQVSELVMDYDPEMMLRILSNLLSNAIKYSNQDGEVVLSVEAGNEDQSIGNYLLLMVKDEGVGISEEQLPHIFDQFYQADDSSTRKREGTGIGLSLTRELVKLLGGAIWVESKAGEGSKFFVQLPVRHTALLTDELPTPVSMESSRVAEPPVGQMTAWRKPGAEALPNLLIIEDNADVRQYLATCLEGHYQLSYAEDGAVGIQRALEEVPEIIISDVMMPQKDGFEVCAELKNDLRTSHIPIILLTAKSDAESRISGLEVGADAYLSKPFNEKELFIRLEKLIEIRKTLQIRYQSLDGGPLAKSKTNSKDDAFILQIQEIVRQHISEETFGIAELCRAIGMGRTQLHNKIKSLTGKSTSHYIRAIRLHKAKDLLANNPELNMTEIAFATGFPNLSYFSKIFADEIGSSPSQYRKNIRSEQ